MIPTSLFLHGLLGLRRCLLGLGTARLHHVEPDQDHNQSSSDTKRRKRDSEHLEDQRAGHGKARQDDETGPRRAFRHVTALLLLRVGGQDQEGRDGGNRIDDKNERAKGQQQKLHVFLDKAQHGSIAAAAASGSSSVASSRIVQISTSVTLAQCAGAILVTEARGPCHA